MKTFLSQNWFKITIIVLLTSFLLNGITITHKVWIHSGSLDKPFKINIGNSDELIY